MKILFIVPYSFIPANSGPKNVIFNLIKFFSDNAICDLVVLYHNQSVDGKIMIKEEIFAHFPNINQAYFFLKKQEEKFWLNRLLNKLQFIWSGYNPIISQYESLEFINWIKQEISSKDYDVVHFDMFYLINYCQYFSAYPTILVPHDAYSSKLSSVNKLDFKTSLQLILFRMMEKNKYNQFTIVCPVSQSDANFLKTVSPQLNIDFAPIAVSDEYLKNGSRSFPAVKYPQILCTRTGRTIKVRKEILFFLEKVYPSILNKYPETKLTLLGKYQDSEKINQLKNQYYSLQQIDYVKDYLDFLQQDWIYTYPQTWGSGLKTKVQQAMALGLPVVGTDNAFSGLEVQSGKHCFICNTANEFEQAICLLCEDVNLRNKIGDEAHKLIKENYSVNAIGQNMVKIYDKAIKLFKEERR